MQLTQLSFSYGSVPVFEEVDLDLPDHGVVALRGPNGCGKTTLLKLLGGLLPSRNASLTTLRRERRVVYLDQDMLSLDSLTAGEYLRVMRDELGSVDGSDSPLIEPPSLNVPVAHLSLGQRQRCVLALALSLADVDMLLLDEPLNGLDANATRVARRAMQTFARQATVLVATHELEDWTDASISLAADRPVTTADLQVAP